MFTLSGAGGRGGVRQSLEVFLRRCRVLKVAGGLVQSGVFASPPGGLRSSVLGYVQNVPHAAAQAGGSLGPHGPYCHSLVDRWGSMEGSWEYLGGNWRWFFARVDVLLSF